MEVEKALFEAEIWGKVRQRIKNPDGSCRFYETMRNLHPIDFTTNEATEFALSSHLLNPDQELSPVYINLRNLPNWLLDKIASLFTHYTFNKRVNLCSGVPNTAGSIAKRYSYISKIPFESIFVKSKSGNTEFVTSAPDAKPGLGRNLLLLEDTFSTGNTAISAIESAQRLDYNIVAILALIDRGQGGLERIRESGYKAEAIYSLPELLKQRLDAQKLEPSVYKKTIGYLHRSKQVWNF